MSNHHVAELALWGIVIATVIYQIREVCLGKASRHWPPHPAKVLDAHIETHEDDSGGKTYAVSIHYAYSFNTEHYESDRFAFGNAWAANQDAKRKLLLVIKHSDDLDVYVNPKNPNQSVVRRGYQGGIVLTLSLLTLIVLFVYLSGAFGKVF